MEPMITRLVASSYFWILFAGPLGICLIRPLKAYALVLGLILVYWSVALHLGMKEADGPVGFAFLAVHGMAMQWIAATAVLKLATLLHRTRRTAKPEVP